jgi:hypothetical protein
LTQQHTPHHGYIASYNPNMIRNLLLLLLPLCFFTACTATEASDPPPPITKAQRVLQPWSGDVNWWSWDGKTPELLLGGSGFEAPFLEKHWKEELNYLKKTRGNYVRVTLPALEGENAPFGMLTSQFDGASLSGHNEYWEKLEKYVAYAASIEIAVEIQVWDAKNITTKWDSTAWGHLDSYFGKEYLVGEHPFFRTIPGSVGYRGVFVYPLSDQERFVDLLLGTTLKYDNVIYNVQVPENTLIPWMVHWGQYIEAKAAEKGRTANINAGIVPDRRINVARFNQSLLQGATVAFHRPKPNGNGMNGIAQASIRGIRVVELHLKFQDLKPAPELLLDDDTEAMAATDGNGNYLIYLPSAGQVNLSPDWNDQVPVNVTVVGYLGTQRTEVLQPPYGESFRLHTEEEKGGWMILKPQM